MESEMEMEMETQSEKRMKLGAVIGDESVMQRCFLQIYRKDEIPGLDIPATDMPRTLAGLLELGYAGKESDWCEEFSRAFTEDGRLRFDEIAPSLPPVVAMHPTSVRVCNKTIKLAGLALAKYNKDNQGAAYEFVAPLRSNHFFDFETAICMLLHFNFLAKPKNSNSSPDLFFAEVVTADCPRIKEPVFKCVILKPRLCASSEGVAASVIDGIFHPQHLDCKWCDLKFKYAMDSDDSDTDDETA